MYAIRRIEMMNRTHRSVCAGARSWVTRVVMAASVVGAACADNGLSPLPTESRIQQSALRADLVPAGSDAQAAIEDALARNIPALEDPLAAAPLQAALAALQEHIEDGNYEAARGAVTAAHRGLAAYQRKVGSQGADAADLDAVQRALENQAWAGASPRP